MNKNRILLAVVCCSFALSWVGCKKGGKAVVAGPPPTGPVELKLKWPTGSRMVQNLDITQTSEIHVPGMPSPMKQNMDMGQKYQLSVLNERGDGGHEVEMEFLAARMKLNNGSQSLIDFDSARNSPGTNALALAFQKVVGARIQFFLDDSNEVWKVEGTEDLRKQLTSDAASDPTGILNSMFTEDYFKQLMNYAKSLPPGPVEPGASWPVRQEILMGNLGTMITDYKYSFKSWERRDEHNCARIEFAGTIKTKPGKNSKIGEMNIFIQGGDSSGETWFDLERGAFVDSAIKQDINMLITVPNQGRRGPPAAAKPMTITNLMHQLITVKMDPAK